MIVEELVTKLGLEVDSNVIGVLEKFRNIVSSGLGGLAVAGAGVAAAFAGVVVQAGLAADEIGDMADKLGVSSTALQELKFAAEQSDVSFESLSNGLKFLSKNAVEAAQGSEEAQKAFAGISTKNADGSFKSADELLRSVVDRFQTIPEGAKQTAAAMKIFGRAGADLVPLLKKGNVEIDKFIQDAHELGVVLDQDAIAQAGEFERQLKRTKSAFLGLRNEFAAPFFEAFGNLLASLTRGIRTARPYIGQLSKAFADLGSRLGTILGFGGKLVAWIGSFFDSVKGADVWFRALQLIEAGLIGLGVAAIATALKSAAAWIVATGPFILLAVLIGLVVDEIYNFIEGNDTVLGQLDRWAKWADPNDNAFIAFLRSAIGLLLDLTNPQQWERFVQSAGMAAVRAGQAIVGGLKVALSSIGIGGPALATSGQNQLDEAFSPANMSFGGGDTPDASAAKAEVIHLSRNGAKQGSNTTVNIDARGMSPEQVSELHRRERARSLLETFNALPE